MNLSLDTMWKLGGIFVIAIGMYYKVDYLEKENLALREEIKEIRTDLKWTTNNLLRFEYGEYAVE